MNSRVKKIFESKEKKLTLLRFIILLVSTTGIIWMTVNYLESSDESRYLIYYTIQSNYIVWFWYLFFFSFILFKFEKGVAFLEKSAIKVGVVIIITITGILYNFMLLPISLIDGKDFNANDTIKSLIIHLFVPLLVVIDHFKTNYKGKYSQKNIWLTSIYLLLYVILVLCYGSAMDWYPYPPIDLTEHSWVWVFGAIILVETIFISIGYFYWYLLKRKQNNITSANQ